MSGQLRSDIEPPRSDSPAGRQAEQRRPPEEREVSSVAAPPRSTDMTTRVVLPLSGAVAHRNRNGAAVQSAWAAPLQDALRPRRYPGEHHLLDPLNLTVIVCTAVFAAVLIAFFGR